MLDIFYTCIDNMRPIKTFEVKQVKESWITPPLLELIKDKDDAMKKAKKKDAG